MCIRDSLKLAPHKVDQLPRQRKPQAQAAARPRHGLVPQGKGLEKFFPLLFLQAGAAVLHHKGQPQGPLGGGGFVRPLHAQCNAAAHCVFDGIVQQDAQHLFQMAFIARHGGGNGRVQRNFCLLYTSSSQSWAMR